MERPVLWLAAIFIGGIAAASAAAPNGVPAALALVAGAAIMPAWQAFRARGGFATIAWTVLLAGILIGTETSLPPAADDVAGLPVGHYTQRGTVAAVLGSQRFVLAVESVRGAPHIRRGRVEIRLATSGRPPEPLHRHAARPDAIGVGDGVTAIGAYAPDAADPSRGRRDAARARLDVTGTLVADGITVERRADAANPRRLAYNARNALDAANRRFLAPPLGEVLSGLVLGVDVVDPELRRAFRDAGLMHALVASGAQLGIAAALLHVALRGAQPWARAGVTLAGVWSFAMLAGFEPSMARAFVMAAIALMASALRRDGDSGTTLALSAAVLLGARPRLLSDIGFQLSFAATAGLIYVAPVVAVRLSARFPWMAPRTGAHPGPCPHARADVVEKARAFLREAIAATLGANAAVLPILVWNFGQIQTLSLVSNLFALPAVAAIVPLGFAAGLAGVFAPAAAPVVYIPSGWICEYLVLVARGVAAAPLAVIRVPAEAAVLGVPVGLWMWLRDESRRRALARLGGPRFEALVRAVAGVPRRRIPIAAVGLVATAVWTGNVVEAARPAELSLTMIDVGQGDALLLETPGGRTVLVDAGPHPDRTAEWLRGRRRTRLDLILLSHPHADHVTGLTSIVERFAVGAVLDPGFPHATPAYRAFLRAVENRRVPYQRARRGASLDVADGVRARLLWPPPRFVAGPSPPNENSSVARVTYGAHAILLTGDIEAAAESALASSGEELSAHTMKVPHQGSRTSSGDAFLRAVRPRIALLSVGRRNEYGHPHRDVIERYRRMGIRLYRTDVDGSITVRTDGRAWWVETSKARPADADR